MDPIHTADNAAADSSRWPAKGPPWFCSHGTTFVAPALIVVAGLAVYANSLSGEFIYDDIVSVLDNPSIRQLWPLSQPLSPPSDTRTVTSRPFLNLSLAVNYRLGRFDVWGYHATNLAIHLLSGLLLLGILRRTFQLPILEPRFGRAAWGLALAIALLWTVHPLQTESVSYISQRAESLAGLFYLLVLYSAIRGSQSSHAAWWHAVAVGASFLGVGVKEIVVTASVVLLLYDRTFLEDSFRKIFRRRWGLYLGLLASWIFQLSLLARTGLSSLTQEVGPIGMWAYARSQPGVILHYLRLSLWPHPLCFNYDWPLANTLGTTLLPMLVVGLLVAATVWGLRKRRGWGFLGAWFFLILAPTSSIMPLPHLAFEHRMYLPLAAVLTLVVAGGYLAGERLVRRGSIGGRACFAGEAGVVLLATVSLAVLTIERNRVYHSVLSIWEDTVQKAPHNPYAHSDLGNALSYTARSGDGFKHLEEAVRLKPDYAVGHNNLAAALVKSGRFKDAIDHCELALRLKPDYPAAHDNWATALLNIGRPEEAIQHYEAAVQINPNYAQAHYNWGTALIALGRFAEAIEHCKLALQIQPDHALAQNNWGSAMVSLGRLTDALEHFELAVRIDPNHAIAHYNCGYVLSALKRPDEAVEHFRRAAEIQPNYGPDHYHWARILHGKGRPAQAIERGLEAARLLPDDVETLHFVASLLASYEIAEGGDPRQAVQLAQRACQLTNHRDVICLDTLAAAYASAGRFNDAIATAKKAWQMAHAAGQTALAQDIHIRLQLYRDHKPYRGLSAKRDFGEK
jgi:tetratricopeptide (TPR) repeat protein